MSIAGSAMRSRNNVSVRRISAAPGRKTSSEPASAAQRPHDRIRDLPLDRDARVAPEIARLDREGAAGALDHRRLAEQPADARAVERRRHDQELEVLAQSLLHVAGERQAEIGVERALVELVEEDGGDAVRAQGSSSTRRVNMPSVTTSMRVAREILEPKRTR